MCLTEPQCGSDLAAIKTSAVKKGDEYILNGTKAFVTNGGLSSTYTVLAVTDKSKGYDGMSLFQIERDWEGVCVGKEEKKMGFRLSNTTEVAFTEVRVPAQNLIGAEGAGFRYIMKTLNKTRPMSIAPAIGMAQAALDHAVAYSKTRTSMGVPICKHQSVAALLANMELKVESTRQLCLYNCELVDRGIIQPGRGSLPKAFGAEAVMQVTTDAVQVFGGYGYSKEYPVEKLMRDAKLFSIFEGPTQIQYKIIADTILGKL